MGLIPASFFQKRVPDKYKQYVTDARSLRAWDKANASGDMSAWEGDVGYQAQAATANPAGGNPPPATATVLPETANTTEGGDAPDNLLSAALKTDPPGVVAQKTGEITEIHEEETVEEPVKVEDAIADPNVKDVTDVETGGEVSQLQSSLAEEQGVSSVGRTPGIINKARSGTIEALSQVGETWDAVQEKVGGYRDKWNEFKGEAGAALRGKIAPGGKPYAVGEDVEGAGAEEALDAKEDMGDAANLDDAKMAAASGNPAGAVAALVKRKKDMVKAGGELGKLRTPTARAVNFGSGDRMNQYKVGR